MKHDSLQQFAKLRTALQQERATLQARLAALNAALVPNSPVPHVPRSVLDKITAEYLDQHLPKLAATPASKGKGKRKMSAAGKARIAAAAKARWAKVRAAKAKAAK